MVRPVSPVRKTIPFPSDDPRKPIVVTTTTTTTTPEASDSAPVVIRPDSTVAEEPPAPQVYQLLVTPRNLCAKPIWEDGKDTPTPPPTTDRRA